jgi:hypothetical protein
MSFRRKDAIHAQVPLSPIRIASNTTSFRLGEIGQRNPKPKYADALQDRLIVFFWSMHSLRLVVRF